MVGGLDEDTVDFVPNYDDTQWQPSVMPAAYPNLLVNGAAGIAVGMATNMAPHNLVEVIGAARHLIAHPTCSLEDLMKFVPGPDLPCGGKIVGLEGIRDAYLTGRGSFRTRATTRIEALTPRRKGIVVTELPYLVGPEKVIDKVKDLVQSKRLQGIADLKDLSDRQNGLRLVIEIKNGFHPEAVLEQLFRLTPMEENFGINNVALVEGQPRTMGLKELLKVYVDFRTDVVRRRSEHRLRKREERLHLVEGLLVAIVDIDEVIQVIRTSDDAEIARTRLMDVFDLDETQATYILELRLRRLTKFSLIELETEKAELERAIEELRALLADEKLLLRARLRRARRRRQGARHPAAHGAARELGPERGRHREQPPRGERRPVLGAALLDRPARPHRQRRADPHRGLALQARRHHRCRAHDGAGGVRPRHDRGPDDPPLGARPADAAPDQRRTQPVGRRSPRGIRRPAEGRGAGHDPADRRRRAGARPRHRERCRQAGGSRGAAAATSGASSASGTATASSARPWPTVTTSTSSSSRATRSCCASPPERCARRVARPAAWPASSSRPGRRRRSSASPTRPARASSSRRRAAPTRSPAPRAARSR